MRIMVFMSTPCKKKEGADKRERVAGKQAHLDPCSLKCNEFHRAGLTASFDEVLLIPIASCMPLLKLITEIISNIIILRVTV